MYFRLCPLLPQSSLAEFWMPKGGYALEPSTTRIKDVKAFIKRFKLINMNTEQVKQFDSIFNALSESLDITETQYEAAVRSYRAVGDWLAKADSVLVSYNPIIRAQGSFMLGTMIRPLNEQDDLDIDLVCELTGKGASWTQYDLKHKVGNRLKDHETYKRMLDEEGRRCWTLKYAQESNYHMDILPCLVAKDYKTVMERSFSASLGAIRELDNLASALPTMRAQITGMILHPKTG